MLCRWQQTIALLFAYKKGSFTAVFFICEQFFMEIIFAGNKVAVNKVGIVLYTRNSEEKHRIISKVV
ncbi:MAG TPA: hypothetical protein DCZ61_06485 [Lachnospiraceae bacterium]|nr:hypothetical protein [Lachnospiraceae bacterium]